MPEPVACRRHPSVPTQLRCSSCGDPICPRCLVQTPVGQKCPDDARQPRGARALGTPRQLGKAIAAAVVLAGAGGVVAGILVGLARGMLGIIVGYAAGIAMGDVVVRAAEGNRGARFRHVAMFGAAALVAIMWQVAIGGLVPAGLGILAYAAAIYAVSTRFP